jgi:hypothetical protein
MIGDEETIPSRVFGLPREVHDPLRIGARSFEVKVDGVSEPTITALRSDVARM